MTKAIRGALLCLTFTLHALAPASAERISLVDVAGRTVEINGPVKRALLGEGRQLLAVALIHPDPVSVMAAWPDDLRRQDEVTYNQYLKKFPGLDALPIVGRGTEATFSIEQAVSSTPDVAILSGGYGPSAQSSDVLRRLEAAGIPVVFIDFVADPLKNTVPSMRLLGKLFGRDDAAERYVNFYSERLDRIRNRLQQAQPKQPTVLMHAHAGLNECCNSPGRATIGAFIDIAGGNNIAVGAFKGPFGQLQTEYVLQRDPEVYVGTGGIHLTRTGLVMGPGIEKERSLERLREIVARPEFAGLAAVKSKRVHGIWHLFNNLPMNVLAIEVLAKWFHPDLFKDVDPDETLRRLNSEFLPVPMQGTYWLSLDGKP